MTSAAIPSLKTPKASESAVEPADHADAERDGDEWGDHGRPEECAVNDSDKNDNEEEQHVTRG